MTAAWKKEVEKEMTDLSAQLYLVEIIGQEKRYVKIGVTTQPKTEDRRWVFKDGKGKNANVLPHHAFAT